MRHYILQTVLKIIRVSMYNNMRIIAIKYAVFRSKKFFLSLFQFLQHHVAISIACNCPEHDTRNKCLKKRLRKCKLFKDRLIGLHFWCVFSIWIWRTEKFPCLLLSFIILVQRIWTHCNSWISVTTLMIWFFWKISWRTMLASFTIHTTAASLKSNVSSRD